MKSITVYFEDKEFEVIKKDKKGTSWHDYILKIGKKTKEAKE